MQCSSRPCCSLLYFFFDGTPTTEIYTLPLHDALPICRAAHELDTGDPRIVVPCGAERDAGPAHESSDRGRRRRPGEVVQGVRHEPLDPRVGRNAAARAAGPKGVERPAPLVRAA